MDHSLLLNFNSLKIIKSVIQTDLQNIKNGPLRKLNMRLFVAWGWFGFTNTQSHANRTSSNRKPQRNKKKQANWDINSTEIPIRNLHQKTQSVPYFISLFKIIWQCPFDLSGMHAQAISPPKITTQIHSQIALLSVNTKVSFTGSSSLPFWST